MPATRRTLRALALAAVLAALCLAHAARAADVQVGVYLLNLGKLDVSTGAFTADFYLSMKSATPLPDASFEFVNGRAASVEKLEDKGNEKFYRILANLSTPIDLKHFPFDAQKMQIIMEDKKETIEKLRYVPLQGETGMDAAIVFPGWQITGWDAAVKQHEYPAYDETYSQYVYTVHIARIPMNSFLKTFLPVLFLMIIVASSFILNPDQVTTRLATISSSLVASAMFHVSITNQIPPVGYLTFADKFMVTTYMVLLCCFFLSLYVFVLQGRKETDRAKRIHHFTERIVFVGMPTLYLALFLFFR